MAQPLTFNHIGINVPDINAAVKWYIEVFDSVLLTKVTEVQADNSHWGNLCKDIFKQDFKSLLLANVVTGNGVGLEFFQFIAPETVVPDNTFEWKRAGIFHFSMTSYDIEETAALIEKHGGKIISQTWKLFANKPYKCVYTQDPWGTVIELCNASFEQLKANDEAFIGIEND